MYDSPSSPCSLFNPTDSTRSHTLPQLAQPAMTCTTITT